MKPSNQERIEAFIRDIRAINPEQVVIIERVRDLFTTTSQDIVEGIKYGGLVFFKSGSLIGGIFPYKKHLSIEFSDGADFSDPQGLLEGKGKRRRHLKVLSQKDLNDKDALFFIQQSVAETTDSQSKT